MRPLRLIFAIVSIAALASSRYEIPQPAVPAITPAAVTTGSPAPTIEAPSAAVQDAVEAAEDSLTANETPESKIVALIAEQDRLKQELEGDNRSSQIATLESENARLRELLTTKVDWPVPPPPRIESPQPVSTVVSGGCANGQCGMPARRQVQYVAPQQYRSRGPFGGRGIPILRRLRGR